MKAMALALLACALATAAGAIQTQSGSVLTVPLTCSISNQKLIVIKNDTGATISAGTPMAYDAVRPNHTHYGKSFHSPVMAATATLTLDGEQSLSCTAWYTRQLTIQSSP